MGKNSIIARGFAAKARVFAGTKTKTVGGLTKSNLVKNSQGKVVSKKASAVAKKRYATSAFKVWIGACKMARRELGLKGFVAIGGKTASGKALYAKAKSFL